MVLDNNSFNVHEVVTIDLIVVAIIVTMVDGSDTYETPVPVAEQKCTDCKSYDGPWVIRTLIITDLN